MTSFRSHRVGDLLRDELSAILSREMEDPRLGLVSVTGVEMSSDLKVANVYLSAVDPDADVEGMIRVLERARGFLRNQLKRRKLGLRHLPELRFHHDDSIERGSRIEHILRELRVREDGEA